MRAPEKQLLNLRRGSGEISAPSPGVGTTQGWVLPTTSRRAMDLHRVEAIGIGKARRELYDLVRQVETGVHYLLLRFDRPVAAMVSHEDYQAFSELARKDALFRALLQGKGYHPASMSVEEFLDLLASHVREVNHASG